jgi:hypothetical protein
MRSIKLGLTLAVTGVFVPVICLPLADGYNRNAGLIANVHSMSVPIIKDSREPDFRVVDSLDQEQHLMLVEYGSSGMTLGFPDSLSNGEVEIAIKAENQLKKETRPKFMRFYGWRITYDGTRIPFRYIASLGAFLIFVGSLIVVFNARRPTDTGQ